MGPCAQKTYMVPVEVHTLALISTHFILFYQVSFPQATRETLSALRITNGSKMFSEGLQLL